MSEVKVVEEKLPPAYIGHLEAAVCEMRDQVASLDYQANQLDGKVRDISASFEQFLTEFRQFVMKDLRDRRYQEALTDQVDLSQQIEARFSQHERVRRYVTGILQAADRRLVRKETVEVATAELMISIPKYWLAPVLVALAAWINDNRELAEKALREAVARDDEKTSLLFALICRRASRNAAATEWLKRYMGMQDPMHIEQKMIIVLDAYANGLFGANSASLCAEQIGKWITELEDIAGFRSAQISVWQNALASKTPQDVPNDYAYLAQYADNWTDLYRTLRESELHAVLHDYVRNVFETPTGNTDGLKDRLDELLDSLVTNFDTEEYPMRRRLRMADLIVRYRGDVDAAQAEMDVESTAFDEEVNLMQMLTNAAMNPEVTHASPATQKLSMIISRDWMTQAYGNVVDENRSAQTARAELTVNEFKFDTVDGSDETAILQKADAFFTQRRDAEISAVKQSPMDYYLAIGAVVVLVVTIMYGGWYVGVLAVLGAALKFWLGMRNVEKTKQTIAERYDAIMDDSARVIRGVCAEMTDYRRDVADRDAGFAETMAYLESISAASLEYDVA